MHTLKGVKTRCYEILCHYELDDLTQWHSLHNNKVRMASNAGDVCGGACPPTPVTHQIRMTPLWEHVDSGAYKAHPYVVLVCARSIRGRSTG